jgi:hypothetical protein
MWTFLVELSGCPAIGNGAGMVLVRAKHTKMALLLAVISFFAVK